MMRKEVVIEKYRIVVRLLQQVFCLVNSRRDIQKISRKALLEPPVAAYIVVKKEYADRTSVDGRIR